jgi:Tol biopolymer transport system component
MGRGMQPRDVYELVNAGDPRISPDGSRVAFTVTGLDEESNEYVTAIWVAPLDGSAEPRRFTSGEKRDATPRWSPDGNWLAFASNRGEEKTPANIYVIPAGGGEARKLTDLKESVEAIVWSPDSSRLAFTARVRDEAYEEEDERKRAPRRFTRIFHKLDSVGWIGDRRKHIFVVDLEGGEPRQLTSGDFEHDSPAWSPDGKRLAFDGLRDERWDTQLINRIYVIDAADPGDPQALTGDEASYEGPSFSPDGSRIAFRAYVQDGTDPHHTTSG